MNSRGSSQLAEQSGTRSAGLLHPATPLQTGMLFHSLSRPGTGVDIEQISIRIDHPLRVDDLLRCFRTTTARHPILGATFVLHGGSEPQVRLGSITDVPETRLDWTGASDESIDDRIESTLRSDRLRDFDLETGPLQRLVIAEIAPDRWWILWSFHHSILDGRSFPIVLGEVFSLYDETDADGWQGSPDFDRYMLAVANQDLRQARSFWTEKLARFETATLIPEAAVPPSTTGTVRQAPSVDHAEIRLGETTTNRLRRLASDIGVSLNTCVQAAWYLVLRHQSQQQVVTFGATRACRHVVANAEDMVGLLINTVPVVVSAEDGETVRDLLLRLKAYQHELRPFEATPLRTVTQCAPQHSGSLFESLVVFDEASLDVRMGQAFPEHASDREFRYDGQTNFPLTLLGYGDPSMLLRLEYDIDRYNAAFAKETLGRIEMILGGFVADVDQLVQSVPYVTAHEHRRFDQWNQTEVRYNLDSTLQEQFEAQVERTPEAVALQFGDDVLSYDALNRHANRLGHHLRENGVGPDVLVGVFAERSLEMMVSIYAILKAGGAYVPLDPEHPEDRLRFMIDDSAIGQVLTQGHLVDQLPDGNFEAIIVDLEDDPRCSCSPENPEPKASQYDLAYLLYTSGSTGKPKGVMIEHRSIINRLLWMQDAFPLDASDCVLQKTPYTFDVSVWELFWPLQVGARLAIAKPEGHRDASYLAETIRRFEVTTLHFVPSMLQLFIEEPTVSRCHSVQRLICSGEALPRSLQDRVFEVLDTELHNLYGPTEAAIDVSWWQCDRSSGLDTVPIGYPIANTELHVLDRDLQRVPIGVAGELHIGGVQVGRGYLNRPELTQEKFIEDPLSPTPGARLYKTGDLVRHHHDGAIEFLGRLDNQIKIRGQRVELGEIESVIADHDSVREVVVTAVGKTAVDTQLVAYVVGDRRNPPDEDQIRHHCAATLAGHMIPTVWEFLDSLPLNLNGKVDRSALPNPKAERSASTQTAPENSIESEILDIWRSVLGHRRFGTGDTFFDAGGNSLLLIELGYQLGDRFQREIVVTQLLTYNTVLQQAALIMEKPGTVDDAVEGAGMAAMARRRRKTRPRRPYRSKDQDR